MLLLFLTFFFLFSFFVLNIRKVAIKCMMLLDLSVNRIMSFSLLKYPVIFLEKKNIHWDLKVPTFPLEVTWE